VRIWRSTGASAPGLIAEPALTRGVTLVFENGLGYDAARLIESVRGVFGVRE